MTEPQFHLSMSGEAPNGESFDVSLHFNTDDHLNHRIDRVTNAAREVMRGIVEPAATGGAAVGFGGDIVNLSGKAGR